MEKRVKVIFDDGCPTCTVGKNVAKKLDHMEALEFIGMNTEAGKELIVLYKLDMEASAYALREGEILGKADMMRAVLAHNGPLGFVMSLPFRVPYFGTALYNLLARHRKHVTSTPTL